MFDQSPTSRKLFKFANAKFGQIVTPIFLLKGCTVVSCMLERPRLSSMDIAPSRSLKTYTSTEIMNTFDEEFWIDTKSDFTMNSLRRYASAFEKSKCLFVNDASGLFASKAERIKERLVTGLSELLEDTGYGYKDFEKDWTLKGKVTMVMNMTSEAYKNYKDRIFGLTLSERFLAVHHVTNQVEKDAWIAKEERVKDTHYGHRITVDDIETEVEIPELYYGVIGNLAQEFSFMSLRTFTGCQDLIKATLMAHASLNRRKLVCVDDVNFLNMIKRYLVNPFSPYEGLIVEYAFQGFSVADILKKIGKTEKYRNQVYRVLDTARIRGILDIKK